MKQLFNKYQIIFVFAVVIMISSCQQPAGNNTGSEYMPDMAHSVAYEANVFNYYYNNTWGSKEDYYDYAKPKLPVNGTVSRAKGAGSSDAVVYGYGDSDTERERATAEVIDNPFQITEKGLAIGKNLYNINCAICHGEKADGNGYLVRDDGGVYPVQPAILTSDEFVAASNGRYYHSIMWGKNLMGAYKDKLSYEERWQVIHYIRSLQAKDRGLTYNQMENTLNGIDVPAGEIVQIAENVSNEGHTAEEHHENGEHQGDDHHSGESHDHGDDHNHDNNDHH